MTKWNQIAEKDVIEKTIESLKANGFETELVNSGEEAKKRVLELLPEGAEVMNMTSVTLDTIGVSQEIQESGKYDSIKNKLMSMDMETQGRERRKLGAAPDWVIGSVHVVTEDGHLIIASNSGSQLPAYSYGAGQVIFVVGGQKIVKNFDEGMKRLYEHTLELESERAHKAYGVPGSAVNKLLVINKEVQPGRIRVILVNELLGY